MHVSAAYGCSMHLKCARTQILQEGTSNSSRYRSAYGFRIKFSFQIDSALDQTARDLPARFILNTSVTVLRVTEGGVLSVKSELELSEWIYALATIQSHAECSLGSETHAPACTCSVETAETKRTIKGNGLPNQVLHCYVCKTLHNIQLLTS